MVVFATVAETGSFSAAARKLGRTQSAITYMIQNLELQTGTEVFDRIGYRPKLTEAGRILLPRAQRILESLTEFRQQSSALSQGFEAKLIITVDTVVPHALLTQPLKDFNAKFPMVEVAIMVQPLDAAVAALHQGQADLGLVVDIPALDILAGLDRFLCGVVTSVLVASPDHPLVNRTTQVRREDLQNHTQLLLSSGKPDGAKDMGGHGTNRWRVNDLGMRRSLLLAGMAWSSMPLHYVQDDLDAGRLVVLDVEKSSPIHLPPPFPLCIAHLSTKIFGPAGSWLLDRMLTDKKADANP